jgi:hypothetical protein
MAIHRYNPSNCPTRRNFPDPSDNTRPNLISAHGDKEPKFRNRPPLRTEERLANVLGAILASGLCSTNDPLLTVTVQHMLCVEFVPRVTDNPFQSNRTASRFIEVCDATGPSADTCRRDGTYKAASNRGLVRNVCRRFRSFDLGGSSGLGPI